MSAKLKRLAYALAIVSAFCAWGGAVCGQYLRGSVYGDEPNWISASFVYTDLLLGGDFTPDHWDCPDLRAWGNLNPHLGEFILGVPLLVDSNCFNGGARFTGKYNFGKSTKWNLENGTIPPPRFLYLARAVSLFVSASTAVAMALAARWLWGGIVPVIVLYLLLLNPLFVKCCGYAFTDPEFLLFNGLSLLCGMAVLAANTRRARAATVCGLGVAVGLAASVKVTAMLVLAAFIATLLATLYLYRRWTLRQAAAGFVVAMAAMLVTIYALNPFCWPDISKLDSGALGHELKLALVDRTPVNFRNDMTLWDALTAKDLRRDEIRTAYPQLANLVLRPLELFLLLPRWNRLFADTPRVAATEIVKRLAWDYTVFPGEFLFAALGVFLSIRNAWRGRRCGTPDLALAALAMLTLQAALLFAKLPIGFDRYYLSSVMFLRLYSAVGVVATLRWAWQKWECINVPSPSEENL